MNSKQEHDLRIAIAEILSKIAKQDASLIKGKQYKAMATVAIKQVYRNEESINSRSL